MKRLKGTLDDGIGPDGHAQMSGRLRLLVTFAKIRTGYLRKRTIKVGSSAAVHPCSVPSRSSRCLRQVDGVRSFPASMSLYGKSPLHAKSLAWVAEGQFVTIAVKNEPLMKDVPGSHPDGIIAVSLIGGFMWPSST